MLEAGGTVPDVCAGLIWLFANAVVVCFAVTASRFAFATVDRPPTALAAGVVYLATVIAVATVLGAVGLLRSYLLLTLACVVGVSGMYMLRSRGKTLTGNARRSLSTPGECLILAGWLLLSGICAGHIVINGLLTFPAEFDGLAYHIPLIDHWLQAGNLYVPDAAWWWTAANAELVGLWIVAPFSGDFFIALSNVPFIVVWALAAIEVGRLAGLTFIWRHMAVLAMLLVHTAFHESEKAMNDLAVAALFFSAVAFALRYFLSGEHVDAILASVAIGLLAGVKYFAIGYCLVVASVVIAGAAFVWGWRDSLRISFLTPLTALPFGGYWYLRNYWLTGAPLYPQGTDTLGIGYPNLWETTLAGNTQPELWHLAVQAMWAMTGVCHSAAVVGAPITGICLTWAGASRIRRGDRAEGAVLISLCILMIGTGAVFACTPFAVEDQPRTLNHLRWAYTPARYGLCFLSTSLLTFVWWLQRSSAKVSYLCARWRGATTPWQPAIVITTPILLAAAIAWQAYDRVSYLYYHPESVATPDLVGATLLGANFAVYCWLVYKLFARPIQRRLLTAGAALVLLTTMSAGTAILSTRWHSGFALHFNAMRGTAVFSRLAARKGSLRIAVLDHHPYPFFGSARQHRVCGPRLLTTYNDLLTYLLERGTEIVASPQHNTGQVFDRYKQGPEWLETHELQFKPLMTSGGFALYAFEYPDSHPSMAAAEARVPRATPQRAFSIESASPPGREVKFLEAASHVAEDATRATD